MTSEDIPNTSPSSPEPILAAPAMPTVPTPAPYGVPLWVVVTVGLVCLGLGLGVSFMLRPTAPAAEASGRPSASAPVDPPKPEPTLLERASEGDPKGMEELNAIALEQRTIPQMVALARGRGVEKRLALDHMKKTVGDTPDKESAKRLMQFAQDGETAREALALIASLPGSVGVDMLFELSNAKATPAEMALFATQLLSTQEVRKKASPALALVFDMKEAADCEARKKLLEKAIEVGDRRLVKQVVALTKKTGCGDKKTDDCHPCLRDDNSKIIVDSLIKIQKRKPPAF